MLRLAALLAFALCTAGPGDALASPVSSETPPASRTIPVSSVAALREALARARPGDVIELSRGTYPDAGTIVIERGGAEGQPVTVRARPRGYVVFTGAAGFVVKRSAHVVLEGFVFETAAGPAVKLESSRHVRVTRNVFRLRETAPGSWVRVAEASGATAPASHHNRIDHNRFEGKSQPGNFVTIDGTDEPAARSSTHDRIDHNHFRNTQPRIPNGKEAVRLGWSAMSRSSGFTTVEHNLFEECDGDPEIVSVKSCDDTIRFNTFRRSRGAVTLRSGNRGTLEGNYFFGEGVDGTGGVRIHGDDHRVVNNYFEGLRGTGFTAPIAICSGNADSVDSQDWKLHHRTRRAVVAFNTLVDNARGIEIGYGLAGHTRAPANLLVAWNLVTASEADLVRVHAAPEGLEWRGNLAWPTGAAGLGVGAETGITVADPLLAMSDGLWRPLPASPAIDGAAAGLRIVTRDIEGQARATPDIGADELAAGAMLNLPLRAQDVGPGVLEGEAPAERPGPPIGSRRPLIHPNAPNPFRVSTTIQFTLAAPGEVEVAVFDVGGRRVALLAEGMMPAGRHALQWRPTGVPAGIYYCRVRSGAAVATQPLLLLR